MGLGVGLNLGRLTFLSAWMTKAIVIETVILTSLCVLTSTITVIMIIFRLRKIFGEYIVKTGQVTKTEKKETTEK